MILALHNNNILIISIIALGTFLNTCIQVWTQKMSWDYALSPAYVGLFCLIMKEVKKPFIQEVNLPGASVPVYSIVERSFNV